MRAFKGQAKPCLRPDMLWCAPQIRAKRLYCFSSVSPFVLPCLKGVGGRQENETDKSIRERERMSHEQVACLSLLEHGVLVKHSLVEFALCFRTTRVMSSGCWSRGFPGSDVDHF